ncbi:MAG: hypothetical protein ABSE73_03075 [Planctomycetota bacterium]
MKSWGYRRHSILFGTRLVSWTSPKLLAVAHEQPIADYRVRDLCAVDQGQDEPAWVTASLVARKWELATAVA